MPHSIQRRRPITATMLSAAGSLSPDLEQAAERGTKAKRRDVAAGHPRPFAHRGLVAERDARAEATVPGNAGQARLRALEVPLSPAERDQLGGLFA